MVVVRKSIEQMRAGKPRVNRAKFDATTEHDPAGIRSRTGRTRMRRSRGSPGMCPRPRIPVATLRNWEQGRVKPDQAAQALLTILYRRPDIAKEALTLSDESAA